MPTLNATESVKPQRDVVSACSFSPRGSSPQEALDNPNPRHWPSHTSTNYVATVITRQSPSNKFTPRPIAGHGPTSQCRAQPSSLRQNRTLPQGYPSRLRPTWLMNVGRPWERRIQAGSAVIVGEVRTLAVSASMFPTPRSGPPLVFYICMYLNYIILAVVLIPMLNSRRVLCHFGSLGKHTPTCKFVAFLWRAQF